MNQKTVKNLIFTAIMCFFMVFGMTFLNNARLEGAVSLETLKNTLRATPLLWLIAVLLESLLVGRLAGNFVGSVMKDGGNPKFGTYISGAFICSLMCPTMTLIAMLIHNPEPSFSTWFLTFTQNIAFAVCYQLLFAGPVVRYLYRLIFKEEKV